MADLDAISPLRGPSQFISTRCARCPPSGGGSANGTAPCVLFPVTFSYASVSRGGGAILQGEDYTAGHGLESRRCGGNGPFCDRQLREFIVLRRKISDRLAQFLSRTLFSQAGTGDSAGRKALRPLAIGGSPGYRLLDGQE